MTTKTVSISQQVKKVFIEVEKRLFVDTFQLYTTCTSLKALQQCIENTITSDHQSVHVPNLKPTIYKISNLGVKLQTGVLCLPLKVQLYRKKWTTSDQPKQKVKLVEGCYKNCSSLKASPVEASEPQHSQLSRKNGQSSTCLFIILFLSDIISFKIKVIHFIIVIETDFLIVIECLQLLSNFQ